MEGFLKDVLSWIPFYPDVDDTKNFAYDIAQKKEFQEFEFGKQTKGPELPSGHRLLPHQAIIQRFLSSHTSYNELLIFHGLGSGKTLAVLATAEAVRAEDLRRKGLQKNATLILVRNETLKENFERELREYFNLSPKVMKTEYTIRKMREFGNEVNGMKEEEVTKKYSNRVIIIDEVHNLKPSASSPGSDYNHLYRFLHTVRNCKKIFLSGTPMWDAPEEIASVMNLLLPSTIQIPTKTFMTDYFIKDKFYPEGTGEHVTPLAQYLQGRVSFWKAETPNIERKDAGDNLTLVFDRPTNAVQELSQQINLSKAVMDPYQYEKVYPRAALDEKKFSTKSKMQYLAERHGDVLVLPDGTFGSAVPSPAIKDGIAQICAGAGATVKDKIKALRKYSSTFAAIADNIDSHPTENVFVFLNFVQGTGGSEALGQVLTQCLGYSNFSTAGAGPRRFAIVTGDDRKPKDTGLLFSSERKAKKVIFDEFNQRNNATGDRIHVLIGGRSMAEGVNLRSVKHVHVLPHWNYTLPEQAIGRAFRLGGHQWLSDADSSIDVYFHVPVGPGRKILNELENELEMVHGNTISAFMVLVSDEKYRKTLQIQWLLKEIAFDCPLLYAGNVDEKYETKSRECDFRPCNFECIGFPADKVNRDRKVWDYSIPISDLDDSTYNLYYPNSVHVETIVTFLFRRQFSLTWRDFASYVDVQDNVAAPTHATFLEVLQQLIDSDRVVRNRFGFRCVIREDQNSFFLVNLSEASQQRIKKILSVYTAIPFAVKKHSLEELNIADALRGDEELVSEYCETENPATFNLTRFDPATHILLLEQAFGAECRRRRLTGTHPPNPWVETILRSWALSDIYRLNDDRVYVHTLYADLRGKNTGSAYSEESARVAFPSVLRVFDPSDDRLSWVRVSPGKAPSYGAAIVRLRDTRHGVDYETLFSWCTPPTQPALSSSPSSFESDEVEGGLSDPPT